jgi:predicted nucleic acid-binding protein
LAKKEIKLVYLDTTIPSYYYEERPELRLHREITRRWWDEERLYYDVYISEIVLMELNSGDYPHKMDIIQLVDKLPVLKIPDEASEIVQVYIDRSIMPRNNLGDAFHLVIASYYKIDFLLTWNCRNLANANKYEHIRLVNTRMGLFIPQIITPEQLFTERNE